MGYGSVTRGTAVFFWERQSFLVYGSHFLGWGTAIFFLLFTAVLLGVRQFRGMGLLFKIVGGAPFSFLPRNFPPYQMPCPLSGGKYPWVKG